MKRGEWEGAPARSACIRRVVRPACLRLLRKLVSMGTRSPPTLFAVTRERERERGREWNESGIQMGEPSSVSRLSRNVMAPVAGANFLRSLANRFPSGRCSVCRVLLPPPPLPTPRDTAGFLDGHDVRRSSLALINLPPSRGIPFRDHCELIDFFFFFFGQATLKQQARHVIMSSVKFPKRVTRPSSSYAFQRQCIRRNFFLPRRSFIFEKTQTEFRRFSRRGIFISMKRRKLRYTVA